MAKTDQEMITEVESLVRQLFEAENEPGQPDVAERILAVDFIPITRANGQTDRDRKETVGRFGTPPNFHRDVAQAATNVVLFQGDAVAVATTVLPAVDSRKGTPVNARYRNMHVFVRREGRWQCVAWQVTQTQE